MVYLLLCGFLLTCANLQGATSAIQPVTDDLPAEKAMTTEIDASLRALDQLITATERTLTSQRHVHEQIVEYRKIKSEYLQDQENRELIVQLVKAAYKLQQMIKANHLNDALDGEFVHELAFFSQIASKKSLPKP